MLSEIKTLAQVSIASGHTVAFGEIGLDYDRLFLTPKEQQLKYFEWQLDIAEEIQLPLFLHMRAACDDFERLLKPRLERLPKKGLVHSFTGSEEELNRMLAMGLDVGVNGCSLKTDENIDVVRKIPLERLQIETDGPWVRKSSFSCPLPQINATLAPHGVERGLMNAIVRDEAIPYLIKIFKRCTSFTKVRQERKVGTGNDGERS
jgi:Tat protein secretion system quality control protein TatD with DNase activity